MKIYTRTGDDGTTGLFGGGRVSKTHPRITAYGTVDEANSTLGLALSLAVDHPDSERLQSVIGRIQAELFTLGADLATPEDSRAKVPRITADQVALLEKDIDALEQDLPPLKQFILPGGLPAAAALHVARTVCRRAERLVVEASESEEISPFAAVYLNRLSDLLFVMARWTNRHDPARENTWSAEG